MTPEDAKEWLRSLRKALGQSEHRSLWHFEQAIDEINKLLDILIPEKPKGIYNENKSMKNDPLYEQALIGQCPNCNKEVQVGMKYCMECGQALDWSGEK